jgi:regulatory protein
LNTTDTILKKLKRFCSYQERSHKQVLQKLNKFKIPKNEIEKIISTLISADFLNETRFSICFARGKFKIKKWGKIKIKNQLYKQNISEWNINKAISEIDEIEYLETFNLLFKKYWNMNKDHILCKKKVYNTLKSKGWENSLILNSINEKN